MTDTQGTDLLQQAIAALQGGIPGQARAILESLTAQGADTAAVWGVLALACRDQEDMPAALEAAEDDDGGDLSEEAIQTRELFQAITPVVPSAEETPLSGMLGVPDGTDDPVDRQREERERVISQLAVIHSNLAGAMARFDGATALDG